MTRKAAAQEAATTAAALLKVDLVGVLVRGWRRPRTSSPPHGGRWPHRQHRTGQHVLDESRWTQRPPSASWSTVIGGHPPARLSIVFDLSALLLVISGGSSLSLQSLRHHCHPRRSGHAAASVLTLNPLCHLVAAGIRFLPLASTRPVRTDWRSYRAATRGRRAHGQRATGE